MGGGYAGREAKMTYDYIFNFLSIHKNSCLALTKPLRYTYRNISGQNLTGLTTSSAPAIAKIEVAELRYCVYRCSN